MSLSCVQLMPVTCAYIILVSETLVAQDIAQTIADFDPGAEVILARTAEEAEAALCEIDTVAVAFIGGNPRGFVGSPVAKAIAERGGRAVLLGVEAEATGATADFDVLAQPFDTDAVLGKLRPVSPPVG